MTSSNSNQRIQQFIHQMLQNPAYRQGNASQFSPANVAPDVYSPLRGKRIAFLGSSVTAGFAAKGQSFVDYLVAKDGVKATKSAVSGTTLAGLDANGYLSRLKSDFSKDQHYQLFVCQLSTNDNRHGKILGARTANDQRHNFDLQTTIGAIEEICRYVSSELECPLAFYTCLQNDPQGKYQQLIYELQLLHQKWGFAIIDLFNSPVIAKQTTVLENVMFDDVHPTQKGYLKIWLPFFEKQLTKIFD